MAFERFVLGGRGTPGASVVRPGILHLNRAACDRFALRRYPRVVLYWDQEAGRIGIEPTHDVHEPGARKIFALPGRRAGICLVAFLRRFGIGVTESVTCPVGVDEASGYVVVDVRNGQAKVKRQKAKRETTNGLPFEGNGLTAD